MSSPEVQDDDIPLEDQENWKRQRSETFRKYGLEDDESDAEAEADADEQQERPSKRKSSKREKEPKKKRSKSERKSKRSSSKRRESSQDAPGDSQDVASEHSGGEAEEASGNESDIEREETKKPKGNKQKEEELKAKLENLIKIMHTAYHADIADLKAGRPAFQKLQVLEELDRSTLKETSRDVLVEKGLFKTLNLWLQPLPDGTLPNLTFRTKIIDIVGRFQFEIDQLQDYVKPSELGKVFMKLLRSPQETTENKKNIQAITDKWLRTLRAVDAKAEQRQKLLDKKKEQEAEERPFSMRDYLKASEESKKKPLRPGDPGFKMGIRLPMSIDLRFARPPKPQYADEDARGADSK